MAVPSLEELTRLPLDERLEIVEALWDSIAADSRDLPVSPEQAAILDERLADLEAAPEAGRPWSEFRRTLDRSR